MPQTTKKPVPKIAVSKAISHTASKAANTMLSTVESTRNSAESMLKIGTDSAKEFFANGSEEAQKAHESIFAMGRGGSEHISRTVDALTRTMNDFISITRENIDAGIEASHIISDIAKSINAELVECSNTNFADNVELCKEAFACRDINGMLELQSKWLSTNMDNFFAQSTRLAEMLFQLATEAAEPINERVTEATERLSKSLAA